MIEIDETLDSQFAVVFYKEGKSFTVGPEDSIEETKKKARDMGLALAEDGYKNKIIEITIKERQR